MRSVKRTVSGLSAAVVCCASVVGLATAATAATNDERTCRGTIGAQSLDVDIRVPSGATCKLNGTRPDGNVKVGRGATLVATNVRVGGNIQAENAKSVTVKRSRVEGSIQLKQGRAGRIELTGNTVDSDIQLFSNHGPSIVVRQNVVDGNLQCKSNKPKPTGGANRVEGNKEDQCARL
jgi:hypothetical protein